MIYKSFSSLVQAFILPLSFCILLSSTVFASNIQIYNNDHHNRIIIANNIGNTGDNNLQFGNSLSTRLSWDNANNIFIFTNNVDFSNNEIQNIRIENNIRINKICDNNNSGEIYFDTTDTISYVCSGIEWRILDNSALASATGLKPYFESIDTTTFATNETKDVIVTGGNFTANTVFSLSSGAILNSYTVTSDDSAILNITAGTTNTTVNIESPSFFGNPLSFTIQ